MIILLQLMSSILRKFEEIEFKPIPVSAIFVTKNSFRECLNISITNCLILLVQH